MESQMDARRMSIKTDEKRKISVPIQAGNKIDPMNILYFGMDDHNINLCIIFNHSNFDATVFDRPKRRVGTEKDLIILEKNLESLNYTVKSYENPKINAIKNIVESVSKLDGKILNCIMFIVMTYGEDSNILWAYDGKYVADNLTSPFIKEDSLLGGVPKLFFIQSCRAKRKSVISISQTDGKKEANTISIAANILVMHSTLEDCLSYRDKKHGSWFIQTLADQLLQGIKSDIDILHILTLVIFHVTSIHPASHDKSKSKVIQIPEIRSTLTKCLKFVKYEEASSSKQNKIKSLPEILRQPNIILQLPQNFQNTPKLSFMDSMKKMFSKKLSAMLSYSDHQTGTDVNISQNDSVCLEAIPSTSSCDTHILENKSLVLLPVNSTASNVINTPIAQPPSCHLDKNEINGVDKLFSTQTLHVKETKNLRKTSIRSQRYLPITHQKNPQPEIKQNKIKQNITEPMFQMVSSVFLHSKDKYRELVEELKKKNIIPESVINLEHAIQLDFATSEDYNKSISFFDSKNIPYHSDILPYLKISITGIPETITEKEILHELRALEYPVAKVERMKHKITHALLPSVIVDVKRSVVWERKILDLLNFLHLQVRVESLYRENRQRNFEVGTSNSPEMRRCTSNGVPEPFNYIKGNRKTWSLSYGYSTYPRQRRASQNTINSTESYQNSSIRERSIQPQTIFSEESLQDTGNRESIPVIMNEFVNYIEGQKKCMVELIAKLQLNE